MNEHLLSLPFFIHPSVEALGQTPLTETPAIQFIEKCGRTCYKSEDRITEDSAIKFFNGLLKRKHYSVIEHSNVVLRAIDSHPLMEGQLRSALANNGKYFTITWEEGFLYISANLRAWVEAFADGSTALKDLALVKELRYHVSCAFPSVVQAENPIGRCQFFLETDPAAVPMAHRRYTFRFICDRGVSHELVRHRPASFSQESTRYVNYANKPMQFIIPSWQVDDCNIWRDACLAAEEHYLALLSIGHSPQQARGVLPNSLKTEVVMTTNWPHLMFLHNLRSQPDCHPQMVQLMNLLNPFLEQIKNEYN